MGAEWAELKPLRCQSTGLRTARRSWLLDAWSGHAGAAAAPRAALRPIQGWGILMIGSEEKTVIRGRDGERDRPQASAGSRPSGSSDVGILRLRIYSNGIEGEDRKSTRLNS